jgi:hypothetical protein
MRKRIVILGEEENVVKSRHVIQARVGGRAFFFVQQSV